MNRSLARATYLSLGWHLTSDALPLWVCFVLLFIYFLHNFPFCFIICTKSSSTSRPAVNYQHAQQGTTAIYLSTCVPHYEERACVDHKITSYECIVNSCFITATIGQPSQAAMWSISRVRSIELGMAVRCRFLCMRDCTKICLVMCLLSSQWGSCVRAYSTKRNSMLYLLWFVPPTSGTKWCRHSLPWISVATLRCLLLL